MMVIFPVLIAFLHVRIETYTNDLYGFKSFIAITSYDNIVVIYVDVVPPTNVRATVLTPRSVQVTWELSPSLNIISYLISYTTTALYINGGSMSVDGTTTSHTLINLEEYTLYIITVQATNSSRTSPNSNEVSVTTYTDGK